MKPKLLTAVICIIALFSVNLSYGYHPISPYAYCAGNPIKYVDPDGKQVIIASPVVGITPPVLGVNTPLLSINDVLLLSNKPTVPRIARVSENIGRKVSVERLKLGRNSEVEQLERMGVSKNNKPFTEIDPKTGQKGTTIPDGLQNGRTVEIKNVQKQSLTKQLRLQEKISNENGTRPILRINKDAKLSEPLKKSSFDIQPYTLITPYIFEKNDSK